MSPSPSPTPTLPELWRWEPNTPQGVTERLSWRTSIASTRSGAEERIRRRQHPRCYVEFSSTLDDYDQRLLDQAFWRAQSVGWVMPLWWDACQPSVEPLITNEIQITGPEVLFRNWRPGEFVALRNSAGAYHVFEIEVFAGEGSTVVKGSPAPAVEFFDAPGPITAWPAWRCTLASQVPNQRITAGVTSVSVSAEIAGYASPSPANLPTQLDGVNVWDVQPNRAETIGAEWQFLVERLDGELGPVITNQVGENPFVDRQQTHVLYNREDTWSYRRWWQTLGGAAGGFLCPTWQNDLVILEVALGEIRAYWGPPGLEDEITLFWPPIYQDEYQQRGRDAILLRLRGQNDRLGYIQSNGPEDNYEILVFDPIQSLDVERKEIIQASWLEPVRLATDDVVIQWLTPEVGIWEMGIRMLSGDAAVSGETNVAGVSDCTLTVVVEGEPDDRVELSAFFFGDPILILPSEDFDSFATDTDLPGRINHAFYDALIPPVPIDPP